MLDTEYNIEDEFVADDVWIYEGQPDFVSSATEDDLQDDDTDVPVGLGFLSRATNAIRNWREALFWYQTNQMTSQIGFNPDGMCLKVCRTARNIPAKHLTAKEAQDATPPEFRIHKVRDFRKGMIAYFDDPDDSNKAGHIVTIIGRVRGVDLDSLDSVLTETNSVVSGELVVVRASYYAEHWGDTFQFATNFLNGVEFDFAGSKNRLERFNNGGPVYNLNLLAKAAKEGRSRPGRILDLIERQVKRLPDSPKLPRVREFKEEWRDTRKIDLDLLDASIKAGRVGIIRQVRDEIKRLIEALPDE